MWHLIEGIDPNLQVLTGITFHRVTWILWKCVCVYMCMCLWVCDHLVNENFHLVNIPSWCVHNWFILGVSRQFEWSGVQTSTETWTNDQMRSISYYFDSKLCSSELVHCSEDSKLSASGRKQHSTCSLLCAMRGEPLHHLGSLAIWILGGFDQWHHELTEWEERQSGYLFRWLSPVQQPICHGYTLIGLQ